MKERRSARATETYLNLFWAIERDDQSSWAIWPLRPDHLTIVPDKKKHIRDFVYNGRSGQVAYTTEEVVWFRYFNPLEEYAGLSPIAPARMAVDMGKDGLRFNRDFLRNSTQPDFVLLTNETMNDNEIEDFYRRWEHGSAGLLRLTGRRSPVSLATSRPWELATARWTSSRDFVGTSKK